MTFKQIGRPPLPVAQQQLELLDVLTVATQQLPSTRRGTCASIQKRNIRLTSRERLIDYGQVADNQREKTEPHSGLKNRNYSPSRRRRSHISIPKRKEGGAAQVNVGS